MKGRIRIIVAAAVALCTAAQYAVLAQDYVPTPVTISKEKVKIDGKAFYSHVVLERQTLFSICKAYNVTIEDIYRYNPDVEVKGLRKNDIIMIPVVDIPEAQKAEPAKHSKTEPAKQIKPEPARQARTEPATVENGGSRKHTVKWYEDLAGIAEKYNVSEAAIMEANGLKDKKLKNRQILLIPAPGRPVTAELKEEPAVQDTAVHEEDIADDATEIPESNDIELGEEQADTLALLEQWSMFMDRDITATLLLPLKATGTTGSKSNMDFYSGALLAARDLTDLGFNIKLNVYDIAEGNVSIPENVLRSSDMIIGPVSSADITKVFTMSEDICPVISPLDQRAEKLTSRYSRMIQAPASQQAQFADIALWLTEDLQEGDKVIVISEKEARPSDAGKLLKATIDSYGISYTPFSYSILEGRDIQPVLTAAMTNTGTNRVVIASESEAFVNDAVRNLNLAIHAKNNVVLYAPAKIRSFETIEVENFHNTALHASLTYYIDYNDTRVQDFILKYRALFGTEPTQFAFQGYDMTRYFISLAVKFGKLWPSLLEKGDAKLLQSNMNLRKSGSGGHINKGVRRIVYGKDYSIEMVK